MAGAFGFEADGDHYDVSVALRRARAPAAKSATPATTRSIIADGFSCREQIQQMTDRTPLHLAQVIQLARRAGQEEATDGRPEAGLVRARHTARRRAALHVASCAAAGFVAGAVAYVTARGRR